MTTRAERSPIRAAVFGTGRIGAEIVRHCADADDIDVVAGIVTSIAKAERDLGEICGIGRMGVPTTLDLHSVLQRADVDLVFYCGLGEPGQVAERLGKIADAGKDTVTLTGLIHPPTALGEASAQALHARAVAHGARIVGAGWNPGFLLDVLPVVWSSGCVRVDRITGLRVAEMRDWGDGVHDECGIGKLPEEVGDSSNNPLNESVALIADSVGFSLDRIETHYEPYISTVPRQNAKRRVEIGQNAGFHKWAQGVIGDSVRIRLEMFGIFCIDEAVDGRHDGAWIDIAGDALLHAEASGNWSLDSYPVTAARAIRVVRPLRTLPPGLYRPDQLPLSG